MPKWYIMDEFGSRIRHSEEPNFRVVPFYHINSGLVYSIMWPVREIEVGGWYKIRSKAVFFNSLFDNCYL